MTHRIRLPILLLAVLALTGCSALKQALGIDTGQSAPVIVGNGMVVFATDTDGVPRAVDPGGFISVSLQDIGNGDLGSTSQARGEATSTQTTSLDPKAVADAANSIIESAALGSPARLLAEKARAAMAAGDVAGAAKLVEEAKVASPEAPVSDGG